MLKLSILTCLFLFFNLNSIAQVDDPGDVNEVPLSGAEYLLGAGIILGIKKLIDFKRSKA